MHRVECTCQHCETSRSKTHRSEAVQRRKKTKLSIAAFADPWLPCRAMGSTARQIRRYEHEDLVSSWGVEQGLLVEQMALTPAFDKYREIIAPRLSYNLDAYRGAVWIDRERYFDELHDDDDETGFVEDSRFGQWVYRRGVDPLRALAAAWIAGSTDEPQPIDNRTRINAVAFSYLPDDSVKWASLDLDNGTIHASKVISAIRADVGDDALLVHSGSGREGRFRVLFRLQASCRVHLLRERFSCWLSHHGFVYGKDFEVHPSQKQGRAPFAKGGCTRYTLDLSGFTKEKPCDLTQAFLSQKTIDLRALANEQLATTSAPKRKATTSAKSAELADRTAQTLSGQTRLHEQRKATTSAPKQHLPRRIVEGRCPPTPKYVRDLCETGITGNKQRHDALYVLARHCRYRRLSEDDAIATVQGAIDRGLISASKDAKTPQQREQQKRYVVKLVRRVYATHELPGRPEPCEQSALTANEVAQVREYAAQVARASGQTVDSIRALLMSILPLFKVAKLAGLPHVRIHKKEWEAAGGSRVAKIRKACEGMFTATTNYRSAKSLRAKGLSERNAIEGAYAQSWKTTFRFDR